MFRMRPTYCSDCSSEMDVGNVARIQKFPSSSFGMNSRPSSGKSRMQSTMGTNPNSTAGSGRLMPASKSGL